MDFEVAIIVEVTCYKNNTDGKWLLKHLEEKGNIEISQVLPQTMTYSIEEPSKDQNVSNKKKSILSDERLQIK